MQLHHRLLLACLATLLPPTDAFRVLLAGDSTMVGTYGDNNIEGWGFPFVKYMSAPVINFGVSGASARSYWRDGSFDSLVRKIQKGDYVVIEFGHNDGGTPLDNDRRGPVFGAGEDTVTVEYLNAPTEVVQTFVTYEKLMVQRVLDHGGIPIVSSMTPNGDSWNPDHKTLTRPTRFVDYASLIPTKFNRESVVYYIDHWASVAIVYRDLGYDNVYPKLFPNGPVDTSPTGADAVARAFVNALKCARHPLSEFLTNAGNAVTEVCQ